MALHPLLDDLLELRHQAHVIGIASHHLVNSTFAGLYASVFRGSGLDFEEVREYREGDDIRNMDWKVTARTNKPHLKMFREERERSVVLCVDQSPHMSFGTRGTFKSIQAARAAALLGWAASGQQDRVGGLTFGNTEEGPKHFRPTKDRRALWRLLDALSRPTGRAATGQDALHAAMHQAEHGVPTGGLIFIIADFNRETATLETTLGRLSQKHTVVLLPIDDPADRELPDLGVAVFTGPDGHLVEVNTSDPEGRRLYREAWERNRSNLLSMASRLGVLMIPLSTQDDVHRELTRGLQHSARTRVLR